MKPIGKYSLQVEKNRSYIAAIRLCWESDNTTL